MLDVISPCLGPNQFLKTPVPFVPFLKLGVKHRSKRPEWASVRTHDATSSLQSHHDVMWETILLCHMRQVVFERNCSFLTCVDVRRHRSTLRPPTVSWEVKTYHPIWSLQQWKWLDPMKINFWTKYWAKNWLILILVINIFFFFVWWHTVLLCNTFLLNLVPLFIHNHYMFRPLYKAIFRWILLKLVLVTLIH
jgi:hypothetical protein